jgi:hypothetical protein
MPPLAIAIAAILAVVLLLMAAVWAITEAFKAW